MCQSTNIKYFVCFFVFYYVCHHCDGVVGVIVWSVIGIAKVVVLAVEGVIGVAVFVTGVVEWVMSTIR